LGRLQLICRRQVTANVHDVERATGVVSDALHSLSQSVARWKVVQVDHVRITDTIQPDVDVTDEHKRLEVGRQVIQHVVEFVENADSDSRRARTTEDGDDAGCCVAADVAADEFKR